jgi:drug/metabolite transporter (DMT)-like permease
VTDGTVALAGAAAVGAAGLWAVGTTLFQRVLAQPGEGGPTAPSANLFKNVCAASIFAAIVLVTGRALPDAGAAGWLALSGILGFALGDTLYFAALPRCGAHTTAMLGNLAPPFAALAAWLVLGEVLAPATLVSMGVVLCGILLVLSEGSSGAGGAPGATPAMHRAGVAFAVVSALTQALAIVVGHDAFEGVEVLPGTLARLAGGILAAPLIAMVIPPAGARRRGAGAQLVGRAFRPANARRLIVPVLFAAVLTLPLHSFALRGAPGGVSAVLFATTPLFTLPLALALGRRTGPRTWLGTLIGFAGVAGVVLTS